MEPKSPLNKPNRSELSHALWSTSERATPPPARNSPPLVLCCILGLFGLALATFIAANNATFPELDGMNSF
jgi:hypothetical protein